MQEFAFSSKKVKNHIIGISIENTSQEPCLLRKPMPSSLSGTILLDWDLNRISDYKVVQPDVIKITGSTKPSPSPTSTPVGPSPTATPTGGPVSDGQIELKLDKEQAKVGDIIKAAINISDINNFAGYQVNIKYDPAVLQAVNPVTGEPMSDKSMPADGTILVNTEYGIISAVAIKLPKAY